MRTGTVHEPELVELMNSVLNGVWASLPLASQRRMNRDILAERIAVAVSAGERDHIALRAAALSSNIIPMMKHNRFRVHIGG